MRGNILPVNTGGGPYTSSYSYEIKMFITFPEMPRATLNPGPYNIVRALLYMPVKYSQCIYM